VAVVTAALGLVGWLLLIYPTRPAEGRGRVVRVHVAPDMTMAQVARALAEVGAVERPLPFAAYARLLGAEGRLRRGEVTLMDDLTPSQVLPHIAEGFGPAWMRVLVPEGFHRFAIASRLGDLGICDEAEFLRVSGVEGRARALGVRAATLEGYLFPAKYELAKGTPCARVAQDMVETWRQRVVPLIDEHAQGLAALQRDLGWGLHEVVTLASIVEKEAAVPEERPIIAGVFLNRLRSPTFRPRRLQADPTVAYGCFVAPALSTCAASPGRISPAMVRDSGNPYNTYRMEGLPPGPIANPGLDALRAVLAPAQHDYLYFVAQGQGRHHFSATLDDHAAAVARRRAAAP
jgi:UPF0755 protein